MWKLKDDSDCPVDFPGNWGYYNMDTQQLDHDDDGTLIQDGFKIDQLVKQYWLSLNQWESDLKNRFENLLQLERVTPGPTCDKLIEVTGTWAEHIRRVFN